MYSKQVFKEKERIQIEKSVAFLNYGLKLENNNNLTLIFPSLPILSSKMFLEINGIPQAQDCSALSMGKSEKKSLSLFLKFNHYFPYDSSEN